MDVVDFHLDSPILREALQRAPTTTAKYEEKYGNGGSIRFIFWVEGGDFGAFEEGLAADPTVTDVVQLAETSTRRLYRVHLTDDGQEVTTFPMWSELDVVLVDAVGTHEGWDLQMRMPNREALTRFREVCEAQDVAFRLRAVHSETERRGTADTSLSPVQREALVTAYEMGYFEIPRGALLADVAASLGVSSQATSERIRRGISRLVAGTLLGEEG